MLKYYIFCNFLKDLVFICLVFLFHSFVGMLNTSERNVWWFPLIHHRPFYVIKNFSSYRKHKRKYRIIKCWLVNEYMTSCSNSLIKTESSCCCNMERKMDFIHRDTTCFMSFVFQNKQSKYETNNKKEESI